MGQVLHGSATTTEAVRRAIQRREESVRALAFAPNLAVAGLGVALWGLHMGFSQGLLAAMVADTAAADLRGTAFGMFNLLTGLALLVASVVAGALWDAYGSTSTFLAGAAFSALALAGLVVIRRRNEAHLA